MVMNERRLVSYPIHETDMGLYSIPFSELNCKQLKTKLIPLNSLALVKGPVFGMSSAPLSIAFWAGVKSASCTLWVNGNRKSRDVNVLQLCSCVKYCILINCLILHLFYRNTRTIERQELAFFCLVFTWTDLAYKRT